MENRKVYLGLVFICFLIIACTDSDKQNKNHSTNEVTHSSGNPVHPFRTLADVLINDTSYATLARALDSTELLKTLGKPGPFTVFAPTNNAFKKLPEGIFDAWMNKRKTDLVNIMSYHIIAGSLKNSEMKDGQKLKTLAGEELIITLRSEKLMVNGNRVVDRGVQVSNGILYTVDGVLFPRRQNPGAY